MNRTGNLQEYNTETYNVIFHRKHTKIYTIIEPKININIYQVIYTGVNTVIRDRYWHINRIDTQIYTKTYRNILSEILTD